MDAHEVKWNVHWCFENQRFEDIFFRRPWFQTPLQMDVFCLGWKSHAIGQDTIYLSCAQWWAFMAYLRGFHIIGHLPWFCWISNTHDRLEQVIFSLFSFMSLLSLSFYFSFLSKWKTSIVLVSGCFNFIFCCKVIFWSRIKPCLTQPHPWILLDLVH